MAEQYTEGQMLLGSDGNTYVVRGGVPRVVVSGGAASPKPVIQRPARAPQAPPIGPKDTPQFQAQVAAAVAAAQEQAKRAADEEAKSKGRSALSNTIGFMRGEYQRLAKEGGAISADQGLLNNALNWAAANIGETIGNPTASKAESTRQTIRNARQALVRSIAASTGISAQQLNSNVELQQMLDMATDPSQSLETINRTLTFIEQQYGSPPAPGAQSMRKAPAAPAKGGWSSARKVN